MHGDKDLIAFLTFALVSVVGILAVGFYSILSQHKRVKNPPEAPIPKTREVRATVVDQYCRVETIGYKTPKTYTIFTVVFQTNSEEIIKLDVPQEMYDGIEKGQTGLLSLVDGELYSFTLEEDPA